MKAKPRSISYLQDANIEKLSVRAKQTDPNRVTKSANVNSEYRGITKYGELVFRTTSETTPGKYWFQTLEFPSLEQMEELYNEGKLADTDTIINLFKSDNVKVYCFPAGTLITMADGTKKNIEDVQIGDNVITHLGNIKPVSKLYEHSVSNMIVIKAEGYKDIVCTDNHKFYVLKNYSDVRKGKEPIFDWVEAKNITKGMMLTQPKVKTGNKHYSIDKAFILGLYLAEGCFLHNHDTASGIKWTLNCNEVKIKDRLVDAVKNVYGVEPKVYESHYKGRSWLNISVYRKYIAEDILSICGRYSGYKHMPSDYLEWDEEARRALFQGMTIGDGYLYKDGKLQYDSCNLQLVNQYSLLANSLGMKTNIFQSSYRNKGLWRCKISAISSKQVSGLLEEYIGVEVKRSNYSRIEEIDGYYLYSFKESEQYELETKVYNIEVEDDNSYIVNGYTVHNCNDPSFLYWAWKYMAWSNNYGLHPEIRKPTKRNVEQKGSVCKHLLSVFDILDDRTVIERITEDINAWAKATFDRGKLSKTLYNMGKGIHKTFGREDSAQKEVEKNQPKEDQEKKQEPPVDTQ